MDEGDNEALTGAQKADMLNNFFSKCFNRRSAPLEAWSESDSLITLQTRFFVMKIQYVSFWLHGLDVSKSSGPDGISAKMLKYTAVSITPSITQLFNLSIRSSRVPRDWKLSSVVPIPKSGRSHSPDNYRPISLLSVLSKMLEKHIHALIYSHLNQYHPLSDSQ